MKYIYFFISLLLLGETLSAQSSFFAMDTIQIVEITFAQSNWDYIMDTTKIGTDGYTLAQEVKVNGVSYFDAGVRYKGNSSYDSTHKKNPLHIKLDFTNTSASYKGYSDIKLSNGWQDPTELREVLSYSILRNYMDAPLSNFAKVYINGVYYGLYSSSETIDDNFLLRHFYTSTHSFFKCNPANVVNGHIPNLTYLGQDSTLYYDRYEMKSDATWKDIVDLCDTIVNNTASLDKILDVDRALWMLAFNDETVNLDSYSGLFAQNYYLYRDHNRRFVPIIWDLNMCFGGFNKSGTANLTIPQMQQLTPMLHSTNASRPLIKNLLADATYQKMYIAHLRTMNNEFFVNGAYETLAQSLKSLIDTSVQSENYAFYNYAQFQNSFTTDNGTVPGLKNLMDARATYLASTTQFQQIPPTISNVSNTPISPVFATNITITASVTNTNAVYLGYRYKKSDRFTRIAMFDDGAHNDGASGDNVYGVDIPVNSLEIQYYIYAENANAGMFSPERAEHEFYTINAVIEMAQKGEVVLNEYMANNITNIENEDGKHKDWIELYNTTNVPVGLGDLYLSDDANNLMKWRFPATAFIPANEYLLVWADDKDLTFLESHTSFNLNYLGDSLFLTNGMGMLYDSSTFATIAADVSMNRCANGVGPFGILPTPTPRGGNACGMSIQDVITANTISIYPNPATNQLSFTLKNGEELENIQLFNSTGQLLCTMPYPSDNTIAIADLAEGIYAIVFVKKNKEKSVSKFIKE